VPDQSSEFQVGDQIADGPGRDPDLARRAGAGGRAEAHREALHAPVIVIEQTGAIRTAVLWKAPKEVEVILG